MAKKKLHPIWYELIPDLAQAEDAIETLNQQIEGLVGCFDKLSLLADEKIKVGIKGSLLKRSTETH